MGSRKMDGDYAGGFVEQARICLRDGDFNKACSCLARAERLNPDLSGIGELTAIAEVCFAAAWKCSCRLQMPKPKNPDWYRILKVDDSADSNTIRKRYRQLALLLHPDKNNNVRAEEAFKLVSEAYACLSDRNSRKSYNLERVKTHCSRCSSGHFSKIRHHQEPVDENWRTEQDKLQYFREKARARVSSLTNDIRTRRSRWNADLENAREKYQNKRVDRKSLFSEQILRPLRESDVFQPGRRFQESDLMSILRGRRFLQREKLEVSQSLDDLLNRMRRDSKEESAENNKHRTKKGSKLQGEVVDSTPLRSSKLDELRMEDQFGFLRDEEQVMSCDRSFSKRGSTMAEAPAPAKKLFKEKEKGGEFVNSSGTGASEFIRRQAFPVFDTRSSITEENSFATDKELNQEEVNSGFARNSDSYSSDFPASAEAETTPIARSSRGQARGNLAGVECSGVVRSEYAESTPFCCGSSKKTQALKEQRQKSEELLKTLERLRQEAKNVAATLDKLKRRVDSTDTN